jgi:hypothetical protein
MRCSHVGISYYTSKHSGTEKLEELNHVQTSLFQVWAGKEIECVREGN